MASETAAANESRAALRVPGLRASRGTLARPFRFDRRVNFARNTNEQFAYVTIGGERFVSVFTTENQPRQVAEVPTGNPPHGRGETARDGMARLGLCRLTSHGRGNFAVSRRAFR